MGSTRRTTLAAVAAALALVASAAPAGAKAPTTAYHMPFP